MFGQPLAQCQLFCQAADRHLQLDSNPSLPDVDAAEQPEQHSQDESHRHGEQRGQQPVKDEFDQLERGVASYPHSVEAVRGAGLRDDIFEANLSHHTVQRHTMRHSSAANGVCEHDGLTRRQPLPGIHAGDISVAACYMKTKRSHYTQNVYIIYFDNRNSA